MGFSDRNTLKQLRWKVERNWEEAARIPTEPLTKPCWECSNLPGGLKWCLICIKKKVGLVGDCSASGLYLHIKQYFVVREFVSSKAFLESSNKHLVIKFQNIPMKQAVYCFSALFRMKPTEMRRGRKTCDRRHHWKAGLFIFWFHTQLIGGDDSVNVPMKINNASEKMKDISRVSRLMLHPNL